jgi:hypothetical protein
METLLNTVDTGLYDNSVECRRSNVGAGKPAPTVACIPIRDERAGIQTSTGIRQFAVILAALLWSQYEFVAD